MAKKRAGAVKAGVKIGLLWSFRFWDVDPASKLPRGFNLLGKGFEKKSKRIGVALADEDAEQMEGDETVRVKQLVETEIATLTDVRRNGRFDLHLTPPPEHDSRIPAGPHSDSPRDEALWNSKWQIQFRSSVFRSLEVDADGFFVVKGSDEIIACEVSDDLKNAGVPPHTYLRIFQPSGSGTKRAQRIEVDVRFDVLRPTDKRGTWLGDKTGERRGAGISFDRPYLVIHCTGHVSEAERPTKKPGYKMGATYIGTQLQTLSSRAAIHYVVNIDGHVVKMVEEERWAHQAGFDPRSASEKGADRSAGIKKNPYGAGWRDFVFRQPDPSSPTAEPNRSRFGGGGLIMANKTSIGIEHVAGPDTVWPQAQIDGAVRLARDIVSHFGILPCDVVRHRDLCFKRSTSASGHELMTHHPGKYCPGPAVPWAAFQDQRVALWPLGEIPGETALQFEKADIYDGVFELVQFMDDKLASGADTPENRAKQTAAISQLQDDIERIGYWCLTRNDGNRGTYDAAARHCIEMIQEKFMVARAATVTRPGATDFDTAVVIQKIISHGENVLPALH